jgi:hypothetical protein
LFWGTDTAGAAAATRYISPGRGGVATLTDVYQEPAPRAGTLRNLFVRHNSAGGGVGNTITYTVLVNGVATAIVVVLATGAIGQASNLVSTVAVAQGDRISLSATHGVIAGSSIDLQATLELA